MEDVLRIGGVGVDVLAATYGTPLYIYDQHAIEERMEDYRRYFHSDVLHCEVLYASKAFCIQEMMRLAKRHDLSLDVVSGGELYTALAAGVDPKRIYFHGNNKSPREIEEALQAGVGTLIVDNVMEGECLCAQMSQRTGEVHVLLRVNPGVTAHTHEYQIFEREAFETEIAILGRFLAELQHTYGIEAHSLDVGGGFAVRYTDADAPIPLPQLCQTITAACERQKQLHGLALERILIEPGRSIVAQAGLTLYTVGFQKQTAHRHYLFVDGGMSANRMNDPKTVRTCVAGKCCESGDVLIEEVMLPPCQAGDLLAVYTTGAYGFSMASHYNRLPRPAVVFIKDGQARCVVRRESYADLLRGEDVET